MSKNPTAIALLCMLTLSGLAPAQNIALTFDDGPKTEKDAILSPNERNSLLLKKLDDAGVKSALFVTLHGIPNDGFSLIKEWGEKGHLIGNHSASHLSLSNDSIGLDFFEHDLLVCDSVIRVLPGYSKLFRFPFLKEGNTIEKRDGFRSFMKKIGYKPAPVSVDASDWYYNSRLLARLKKDPKSDVAAYRKAYLNHLWNRANYYDSLSKLTIGHSVNYVLLLHHNTINAMFANDVIAMFNKNGWKVIDAKDAFQDPIYQVEPKILPAGESFIWSIAKEHNCKGLRYPGEDDIYEKPILDSLGL